MGDVGEPLVAPLIPLIAADNLRAEGARRLTGPGLLWDRVGAVLEVGFEGLDPALVVTLWQRHARRFLDALGWPGERAIARRFDGGAMLAISAPLDQLYTATDVAEAIWHCCAADLLAVKPVAFATLIAALREGRRRQRAKP